MHFRDKHFLIIFGSLLFLICVLFLQLNYTNNNKQIINSRAYTEEKSSDCDETGTSTGDRNGMPCNPGKNNASLTGCEHGEPDCVPTITSPVSPRPSEFFHTTAEPQPSISNNPDKSAISLIVRLHGIGTGGDNANPTGTGNMQPLHRTRTVSLLFYTNLTEQPATVSGTITYTDATGDFRGMVDTSSIKRGSYYTKVSVEHYLRNLLPGYVAIPADQQQPISVTLVTGDINNDNRLNMLDYNILSSCYQGSNTAGTCSDEERVDSDIDDNGVVNQYDYNLFMREIENMSGE